MTEGIGGKKEVNGTKIMMPDVPGNCKSPGRKAKDKPDSRYQRLREHGLFRKRAGIGPTTGHMASDFRLGRNFYRGMAGDAVNILLAAAAYNFKRAMKALFNLIRKIIGLLCVHNILMKTAF